ncbi:MULTISPECIES: hypothetical protein, partial [Halocynthiibacter]
RPVIYQFHFFATSGAQRGERSVPFPCSSGLIGFQTPPMGKIFFPHFPISPHMCVFAIYAVFVFHKGTEYGQTNATNHLYHPGP